MSKHTPGPWEIGAFGPYSVAIIGRDREVIYHIDCQVHVEQNRTDARLADARRRSEAAYAVAIADATLIAAAPELLTALKALMPEGWVGNDTMDHMPGVKAARLAIAKAEGAP